MCLYMYNGTCIRDSVFLKDSEEQCNDVDKSVFMLMKSEWPDSNIHRVVDDPKLDKLKQDQGSEERFANNSTHADEKPNWQSHSMPEPSRDKNQLLEDTCSATVNNEVIRKHEIAVSKNNERSKSLLEIEVEVNNNSPVSDNAHMESDSEICGDSHLSIRTSDIVSPETRNAIPEGNDRQTQCEFAEVSSSNQGKSPTGLVFAPSSDQENDVQTQEGVTAIASNNQRDDSQTEGEHAVVSASTRDEPAQTEDETVTNHSSDKENGTQIRDEVVAVPSNDRENCSQIQPKLATVLSSDQEKNTQIQCEQDVHVLSLDSQDDTGTQSELGVAPSSDQEDDVQTQDKLATVTHSGCQREHPNKV